MAALRLRTLAVLSVCALPACNCGSGTDPVITTFTATPSSLPMDGGTTTLAWTVTGASSLSIAPGVGTVTPATTGSTTAEVGASTTFTLSATNSTGTVTQTAAVCVAGGPVTATATSPDTYTACNAAFMTNIQLTNGSCDTVTITAADGVSPNGDCALTGSYTNLTATVPAGQTGTAFDLTNGIICCQNSPCNISCTDTMTWTLATSAGPVVATSNQFSIEQTNCNQLCPNP